MDDSEQILAVAKVDGWRFIERVTDKKTNISWDVYFKDGQRASLYTRTLPDYLNDLNAIHDVTIRAGEPIIKAMRFYLWEICGQMKAHCATARERVEALLRSTGDWKETETKTEKG